MAVYGFPSHIGRCSGLISPFMMDSKRSGVFQLPFEFPMPPGGLGGPGGPGDPLSPFLPHSPIHPCSPCSPILSLGFVSLGGCFFPCLPLPELGTDLLSEESDGGRDGDSLGEDYQNQE